MRYLVLAWCVVGIACGSSQLEPGHPNSGEPAGVVTPGGDSSEDGDHRSGGDDAPLPTVRFAVLGDAGEGNLAQFQVADAIEQVCVALGCDFALYLGDNFYNDGVSSLEDDQFDAKFEQPYQDLDFPFYVVLGNHDYGSTAIEAWRIEHQIAYTALSAKWTLPSRYYAFDVEHVRFLGLDTNAAMLGNNLDAQMDWIDTQLGASTRQWHIAFGHHPYLSNGSHGNAGNYEGCSVCPIVRGENIKKLVENSVIGSIDVMFSGHDHNRQWFNKTYGTHFVVSGAGCKTKGFKHRDGNPTLWEDDTQPGFLWVRIEGDAMTGKFYDQYAAMQFEHTVYR